MNRKTLLIIVVAVILLALIWLLSPQSIVTLFGEATTVITNERIAFDETLSGGVFEDCYGEDIHVTYEHAYR